MFTRSTFRDGCVCDFVWAREPTKRGSRIDDSEVSIVERRSIVADADRGRCRIRHHVSRSHSGRHAVHANSHHLQFVINVDLSICASFSAEAQNGADGLVRSLAKAPRSCFLRGAAEKRRTAARRASASQRTRKGQRSRPVSEARLRDFVATRTNWALSLSCSESRAVLCEGLRPGEGRRRRVACASVGRLASRLDSMN